MAFIIIDRLQEEQRLDFDKLRRLGDSKSFRAAAISACEASEAAGRLCDLACTNVHRSRSALDELQKIWGDYDLRGAKEISDRWGRVELQELGQALGAERHRRWRVAMADELRACYGRIVAALEADLREAAKPSKWETKYAIAPETSTLCKALHDAICGFKDELARLEASELGYGKDLVFAAGPRVWCSRFINEPL
jgi:hypothetical protein